MGQAGAAEPVESRADGYPANHPGSQFCTMQSDLGLNDESSPRWPSIALVFELLSARIIFVLRKWKSGFTAQSAQCIATDDPRLK